MTSKVEELKSQFEEEVKKLKQLENGTFSVQYQLSPYEKRAAKEKYIRFEAYEPSVGPCLLWAVCRGLVVAGRNH